MTDFRTNAPQWRVDDLRTDDPPKRSTAQDADQDAHSKAINKIAQADFQAARERDLDERLKRLSERFGVAPPTPQSWTWADRLRGGKPDTRTLWQRTKERK